MATIFGAINVETPAFETVKQASGYELRKYAPQVRARCPSQSATLRPASGSSDARPKWQSHVPLDQLHGNALRAGAYLLAKTSTCAFVCGVVGKCMPLDAQVRAEYSYTVASGTGITDSLNSPFMVLAGYIFGKNKHSSTQLAEKVAMTSPVVMSYDKPEKIAMTAPVVMQQASAASGPAGDASRARRMAFIMPSKYGHASDLPVPLDAERVKLVEVPSTSYAAVRFKGSMSAKTAREQEQSLREACARDGVALSSDAAAVQYCSYNPPWTLPWLRTNDILIPIADS